MAAKKKSKYSWSRIDLFRKCPHAYKKIYLEFVPRIPSDALETGREAHGLIERYLNALYAAGRPTDWDLARELTPAVASTDLLEVWEKFWNTYILPEGIADAGVERKLAFDRKWQACEWTSPDAFYRLVIDHHYRQDDLGVIEDWKTGWNKPDSLDKDLQTRSYGWGLRQGVYQAVPLVLLRHHYVRFKNPNVEVLLEASDLDTVPEELLAEIVKIEAERHFDPAPGNFCSWCGVQDHCEVMAKAVVPAEVRAVATREQAEKAAQLLLAMKEMEKLVTERLKEFVKGNGPVTVGDLVFGPRTRVSHSPDAKAVVEALLAEGIDREAIWPMVGVTKTKLTSGLKKLKRLDLLEGLLGPGKETTVIDFAKAVGGDE